VTEKKARKKSPRIMDILLMSDVAPGRSKPHGEQNLIKSREKKEGKGEEKERKRREKERTKENERQKVKHSSNLIYCSGFAL
jgi:hypothetical protein